MHKQAGGREFETFALKRKEHMDGVERNFASREQGWLSLVHCAAARIWQAGAARTPVHAGCQTHTLVCFTHAALVSLSDR